MSYKDLIKNLDSDFAGLRRQMVAKRNKLNKSRARTQEREVMRFLGGNRVPMSGAGSIKGDGLWSSPLGLVIIECKYSSSVHARRGPELRFDYKWIPKLENDVHAMRARFGFFAFHYRNQSGSYVNDTCVIPEHWSSLFMLPEWIEHAMQMERPGSGATLALKQIQDSYAVNPVFPCTKLLTPSYTFIMLSLKNLRYAVTAED